MTREEFLRELRIALQGEISQAQVNEQLDYYERYMIEESRKGKSQEQVLAELGNPRLIAKTIIETTEKPVNAGWTYEEPGQEAETSNLKRDRRKGFHISFDETDGWDIRYGRFKLNSWYGTLAIVILVVLIIFILANLTLALLPILLPALLILFILTFLLGR